MNVTIQEQNEKEVLENTKTEEKGENKQQTFKYIYGISFKKAFQTYYFGSDDDRLFVGDNVVVETIRGLELGLIKMERKDSSILDENFPPLKPIIRRATDEDIAKAKENEELANAAAEVFVSSVNETNLDMHLVSTEYVLDATKVIFTYMADDRVDFRELLKVLAAKLHCRIELRQIGARDRAKAVGGLGPCGLPLCCNTFLSDFEGISINMAKNQLLALNIAKLSGQCGKLSCCLKYEDSIYTELRAGLPKIGSRCMYHDEQFKITSMNVLSKTIKLENKENIVFVTFDEYFKDATPCNVK